jgi:hypothetical protein
LHQRPKLDSRAAIFVGIDAGPRETLAPIAEAWGTVLESRICTPADTWGYRISQTTAAIVVVGTSDSTEGKETEAAVRVAARSAGVLLVAVEDYPGNYVPVAGGDADLLLAESDAAKELAHLRLGARCPRAIAISPARFDAMRLRSTLNRRSMRYKWIAQLERQEPAALLWIGQPETEDCVTTLKVLLPLVQAGGLRLLFRAHPRDAGYTASAYAPIAQALGKRFVDVTKLGVPEVFAMAPRLVVTQFSSMVVEAGFQGIPALCLLFPEAGMDRLYSRKGYRVPIVCEAGAAGVCVEPTRLPTILRQFIEDEDARQEVLSRFDSYFEVSGLTCATSIGALKALLNQGL